MYEKENMVTPLTPLTPQTLPAFLQQPNVVIWFATETCRNCTTILPLMNELAKSHTIGVVYHPECEAFFDIHKVTEVPAFQAFQKGQPIGSRILGASESNIRAFFQKLLH